MSAPQIPESREVFEEGNRRFDEADRRWGRINAVVLVLVLVVVVVLAVALR